MVPGHGVRISTLVAVLGCVLAGCVDTYRSLGGLDRNDPDPAVTPYSVNLAAGEAADYPNLATVPPPPVLNSTQAERDQLARSLIDERVQAERALAASAASSPRAASTLSGKPAGPATATAAASVPAAAAPAAAVLSPGPVATEPPLVTAAASPPVPAPAPSQNAAAASAPPASATKSDPFAKGKSGQAAERKPGEPPEPGALEANLQIPDLRSLPAPERPQPPPPPPQLGAAPMPAPASSLATVASAGLPAPAPPVPVIEPPPPPPALAAKTEPKRPPIGVTLATFNFATGSEQLSAEDRSRFSQVAAAYKEKPGTVRIVAYTPPTGPGIEQLNSYRSALDRAQRIAAALKDAGIPANKIQSEAAPLTGGETTGRVDVQLLP